MSIRIEVTCPECGHVFGEVEVIIGPTTLKTTNNKIHSLTNKILSAVTESIADLEFTEEVEVDGGIYCPRCRENVEILWVQK